MWRERRERPAAGTAARPASGTRAGLTLDRAAGLVAAAGHGAVDEVYAVEEVPACTASVIYVLAGRQPSPRCAGPGQT